MAKIDSGSKSSRLLASRRYTHDTLTTAQESFTNVLDLRSEEVYTQAAKIPSSGLPFSGSSQSGSFYTVQGENILKYWYRHSLTKSNLNKKEPIEKLVLNLCSSCGNVQTKYSTNTFKRYNLYNYSIHRLC